MDADKRRKVLGAATSHIQMGERAVKALAGVEGERHFRSGLQEATSGGVRARREERGGDTIPTANVNCHR